MQSLRGSLNDLGRLFDSAPDPVYVVDDEGRIIYLNAACAAWTGIRPADLLGQQCHYIPGDGAHTPAAVADALAPTPEVLAGAAVRRQVACPAPGGPPQRRSVQFVPLGRGRAEMVGVIALAGPQWAGEDDAPTGSGHPESEGGSENATLHERVARFRRLLRRWHDPAALVGESPCLAQVRAQLSAAAASAATVLVVGPPGSGRQRIARTLHHLRDREGNGRLAPLACALLDAEVLQSTLHAAAAAGRSEAAETFTLLLNDVERLPAEAQGQLWSLLRDPPPGMRVIATAGEPLVDLAERGDYRLDLACALATITIRLERLAERPEDVPLLAQWFVEQANAAGEKQLAGFSPEALDQLVAYEWPGETSELADVVAEAHRAAEGYQITAADLPRKIALAGDAARSAARHEEGPIDLERFLGEIETELIRRALARAKGNKTKAARLLGMTRPRLYRRLVQLGLEGD